MLKNIRVLFFHVGKTWATTETFSLQNLENRKVNAAKRESFSLPLPLPLSLSLSLSFSFSLSLSVGCSPDLTDDSICSNSRRGRGGNSVLSQLFLLFPTQSLSVLVDHGRRGVTFASAILFYSFAHRKAQSYCHVCKKINYGRKVWEKKRCRKSRLNCSMAARWHKILNKR